jgi:outer membrane protein assembly factor BamB
MEGTMTTRTPFRRLALRLMLVASGLLSLAGCALPAVGSKPPTAQPSHSVTAGYVTTADSLYALDIRDGSFLWRHTWTGKPHIAKATANVLYVYVDVSNLYAAPALSPYVAIRAADGVLLWQPDSTYYSFIDANDSMAFFRSHAHSLVALSAATGQEVWHWDSSLSGFGSVVILLPDTVLVRTSHDYNIRCPQDGPLGSRSTSDLSMIDALDIHDGSVRWSIRRPHELVFLAAGPGVVYWTTAPENVCGNFPGHLVAADAASGAILWQQDAYETFILMETAGDAIIGEGSRGIDAFSPRDGAPLWHYGASLDAHIVSGAWWGLDHSLLVANTVNTPGTTEPNYVMLDRTSGKVMWIKSTPPWLQGMGSRAGIMYTIAAEPIAEPFPPSESIVAFDIGSGEPRWTAAIATGRTFEGGSIAGTVVVVPHAKYICSHLLSDVTVTALDVITGHTVWEHVLPSTIYSKTPTVQMAFTKPAC